MIPAPYVRPTINSMRAFVAALFVVSTFLLLGSASPAEAMETEPDSQFPDQLTAVASLSGPSSVSGGWSAVASGDRAGDGWLVNRSGDGWASYNFGRRAVGSAAVLCWIPPSLGESNLLYRMSYDRRGGTISTAPDNGESGWTTLRVGPLSSQYDLVVTVWAVNGDAAADECHLVVHDRSRDPVPPWHPTATEITKSAGGVTFEWEAADGGPVPTSHRVLLRVPSDDRTALLCDVAWSGSPWPGATEEKWQTSCSLDWEDVERQARAGGIGNSLLDDDLDISVVAVYSTQRYGSVSYRDEYQPTTLVRPRVDLPRPGNPAATRVSEVKKTSALVSWDHPSGSNAVTYRVWLSDVGPAGPFCESSTPFSGRESCRLTGLQPGTQYTANVFAMNADGRESLRTIQVNFTTKPDALALPGDPRRARVANVTKNGVTVWWDHPTGSNAVTYRVWLSDVGAGGPFCEASAPFGPRASCRITGLDSNTSYVANVFAMNADGGRSVGAVQVAFTTDGPPDHCAPDGKYTKTRDKGIRKANAWYDRNVEKAFDRLEDKPNKLARKIKKLAKTHENKLAKVEAKYAGRCGVPLP